MDEIAFKYTMLDELKSLVIELSEIGHSITIYQQHGYQKELAEAKRKLAVFYGKLEAYRKKIHIEKMDNKK